MKRVEKIMSIVTAMILAGAPSTLLAEASQSPTPENPFVTVDPQAPGTKVSGFVTLAFDTEKNTDFSIARCGLDQSYVHNLYVVATMQKGNVISHYASDYTRVPETLEGCWATNQDNQVRFLNVHVLERLVIPNFFVCTPPNCPGYAIKRVSPVTDAIIPADSTSGNPAFVFEVEIAVKD